MIIVPTKYYKVPTDHFKDLGVSLIIWANHNLRASIAAIQQTTKQIYTDQSLVNVEEKVGLKRRGKGKGLFQKKAYGFVIKTITLLLQPVWAWEDYLPSSVSYVCIAIH